MGSEKIFRVPCKLTNNGISISILALPDSGAHGFCFINRNIATNVSSKLGIVPLNLPNPITPKGYNGVLGRLITQFLVITMIIDGHTLSKIPFLILDLGNQDVILGDAWMAHFDVLPDLRHKKLFWRTPPKAKPSFQKEIVIPRSLLQPVLPRPDHQADADRRDRAILLDEQRAAAGHKSNTRHKSSPIAAQVDFSQFIPDSSNASCLEIDEAVSSKDVNASEAEIKEVISKVPHSYHDFIHIFSKKASNTLPPQRHYDHKIELVENASMGYGPLYSQSSEELKLVKQYLMENLERGWIEPSQAPYSSPVLFVKKPNGGMRFCVDYRKLNAVTKKDRYPLPLIDETLARLGNAKIFTKLDIRQAFHRIRMDADSEELTTFRTRYGAYKYKVLPFGLTNGPATFQRYINDILFEYLDVFCTAYLDDILIYSNDISTHQNHVKLVLKSLNDAGLQADVNKCEFEITKTRYLGFIISTEGISVDPEKISAINNWLPPTNVKSVQSFLGFCNFYRRFIRNYGIISKPLTKLTHKGTEFLFTNECNNAFMELKQKLISAPVLMHYNPKARSQIETDASDGVIAAVLSQLGNDNQWHPVSYFSKTMAPAELNYEIHDKEMLAIVRSFKQWRAELHSSPFKIEVFTDHKALEYFMSSKALNARQARWAELLAEYDFIIKYRPGKSNTVADTLTRREQDTQSQNKTKAMVRERILLKKDQLENPFGELTVNFMETFEITDKLLTLNREHTSLAAERLLARNNSSSKFTLENGLLLYDDNRLVVPDVDNIRTALVQDAHNQPSTAHPGVKKTFKLLASRYYWKGMGKFIQQFINNCHTCKRAHVSHDKTPGLLHPLPIPTYPWQHICMDFKKMPEDKEGFNMVVVFIDRLSKKAVTIPCKITVNAKNLAEIYLIHCFRHVGIPESIVSDRGAQFISYFWKYLCQLLQVERRLSTAYHPETDGQTEIMNQYLDLRLRPFINHFQDNWGMLLPLMDFAQLALYHESIKCAPFELLFGRQPRFTFDWKAPAKPETACEKLAQNEVKKFIHQIQDAWKWARENMSKAQIKKQKDTNLHRRIPDFDVGDKVWLNAKNLPLDHPSRKLGHQNVGPFPITQKIGFSYKLELPNSLKHIHPVFHAKLLRKDPSNPVAGQKLPEPQKIHVIPGEIEFAVESIRAVKLIKGKLRYRANWLGCDEDPIYYPASNFMYSPHLLRRFHWEYPNLPGPPTKLPQWITAYEKGRDDYSELKDDSAMDSRLRAAFFEGGGYCDNASQKTHTG